jgi:SAM-dependent methyltransferase
MQTVVKLAQLRQNGLLGMAIRGEIGVLVSRLGELVGSEGLVYNAWTFDMFHRLALEVSPVMVDAVLRRFPSARSVADIGSGTGPYTNEFRKRGLSCTGFEYSPKARAIATQRLGLQLEPFDLSLDGTWPRSGYDLAVCIEVAEHVPANLGDRLVSVCARAAPHIVFTAAAPGQGGQGHVNEQPKEYWIERFARHGRVWNESATEALARDLERELPRGLHLARNILVFEARGP